MRKRIPNQKNMHESKQTKKHQPNDLKNANTEKTQGEKTQGTRKIKWNV